MPISIEKKRKKILEVYPKWTEVYTMEDRRIAAIYKTMSKNGRFDARYKKKSGKPDNHNYQYNLVDWMEQKGERING